MTDYYSILGISKTADATEIKTAFRRLAKIYHPDKNPDNPDAKHLFQTILKAYNILIHPSARRRYDMKGTDATSPIAKAQQTTRKTQKEWTFTEEELQRRQYYEKHYKAKQKERAAKPQPTTKIYSDYKYVLFATPIAIALFMFVISIFTETPPTKEKTATKAITIPVQKTSIITEDEPIEITNGTKPYNGYFGNIKTDTTLNSLQITNRSNYDAVIILFDKITDEYLQHAYIESTFLVTFSKLPNDGVYWKCMLGKNWDKNKLLNNKEVKGGFDSIVQYQNRKQQAITFTNKKTEATNDLRIFKKTSKNKKMISNEAEFFIK